MRFRLVPNQRPRIDLERRIQGLTKVFKCPLLSLDIVGLTETRIIDSGRTDAEDSLLLHSGGTTHVLEADLSPHGSIRSAGTREYW